MIPTRRGSFIVRASFALAFWSYIPLYVLPIATGGCLLKVLIEVRGGGIKPTSKR